MPRGRGPFLPTGSMLAFSHHSLLSLQILDLCLQYMTHDPNYNYDDDDDYPAYRGSLYEEEVAATTQRRTRGMRKQVNYEEFF